MTSVSRKLLIGALVAVAAVVAVVFALNTNLLAERVAGRALLLAHRGIAPRYDMTDVKADTCTATRMLPTGNRVYIENTIPSMRASFAAGADVVELDIHPTTDGEFAVFHDWTLDCRTEGHGVTREHAMADLRRLDVGYGYTADGGKTFPFRGKGVGLMPTLREVIDSFPNRRFLINIKSRDASEGERLAAYLKAYPAAVTANLSLFGADAPIAPVQAALPHVQTTTRASAMACLKDYALWGWSGIVPAACHNRTVYIPLNMAPWLWGWPNRLLTRLRAAGSDVFVIGPYTGGQFSSGVDSVEQLRLLPDGWAGGIMTNELELIAEALGRR